MTFTLFMLIFNKILTFLISLLFKAVVYYSKHFVARILLHMFIIKSAKSLEILKSNCLFFLFSVDQSVNNTFLFLLIFECNFM